jgi:hypothetical protein
MRFMVVERFKNGSAAPVYRRFRAQGRLMPAGLVYVESWVAADLTRCYQIMECDDRTVLDEWMSRWTDLIDFEVVPVIGSADAAALVLADEESSSGGL